MCFHLCFYSFSWNSNRNCKFYNRIKICVLTAEINKYKSIIRKKRKGHDKIVLLANSELNNIEALISKALIDSNISPGEFVLINNVLKEFYDMEEEIENSNDK